MKILINNEEATLAAAKPTIESAIQQHLTALQRMQCFAVSLNGCFIAKESYANTSLCDNDSVEFFFPIQGG